MQKQNTQQQVVPAGKTIKIVDLFAGPGGLGEGFSSHGAFQIAVSAEMESSAHATLRLRAFYRTLKRLGGGAASAYFDLCNGKASVPKDDNPLQDWSEPIRQAWIDACKEALQLTLGEAESNARLDRAIRDHEIGAGAPWVLIGGPPCQAYSLVGRARNKGKEHYKAEDDHRHFLYKEYLRIIAQNQPNVFVMENVKGILSSKVGSTQIFHSILKDLADCGYRIHSLVTNTCFNRGDDPTKLDARDFIVRSEQYGIPQARHRVILLGIREDVCHKNGSDWWPPVLQTVATTSVKHVIGDLPPLRSKISKGDDSAERWKSLLVKHARELAQEARLKKHGMFDVAGWLDSVAVETALPADTTGAANRYQAPGQCPDALIDWYTAGGTTNQLTYFMNHEARGHMESDLRRYVFAAAFAKATGSSPKGHEDFALRGLAPDHDNWTSGKFADRFRVQLEDRPATTVTSHIAKDGHYFIHYDPLQCRSLTVREAARLQTFPDDYFFQGNRTQQYHQVGNAVPPLLAYEISKTVFSVLNLSGHTQRT